MSDALAQYKKKDGTVSVAADGSKVTWTASGATAPALSIAIGDIASMLSDRTKEANRSLIDALPRSPADTCHVCQSLHQDCRPRPVYPGW